MNSMIWIASINGPAWANVSSLAVQPGSASVLPIISNAPDQSLLSRAVETNLQTTAEPLTTLWPLPSSSPGEMKQSAIAQSSSEAIVSLSYQETQSLVAPDSTKLESNAVLQSSTEAAESLTSQESQPVLLPSSAAFKSSEIQPSTGAAVSASSPETIASSSTGSESTAIAQPTTTAFLSPSSQETQSSLAPDNSANAFASPSVGSDILSSTPVRSHIANQSSSAAEAHSSRISQVVHPYNPAIVNTLLSVLPLTTAPSLSSSSVNTLSSEMPSRSDGTADTQPSDVSAVSTKTETTETASSQGDTLNISSINSATISSKNQTHITSQSMAATSVQAAPLAGISTLHAVGSQAVASSLPTLSQTVSHTSGFAESSSTLESNTTSLTSVVGISSSIPAPTQNTSTTGKWSMQPPFAVPFAPLTVITVSDVCTVTQTVTECCLGTCVEKPTATVYVPPGPSATTITIIETCRTTVESSTTTTIIEPCPLAPIITPPPIVLPPGTTFTQLTSTTTVSEECTITQTVTSCAENRCSSKPTVTVYTPTASTETLTIVPTIRTSTVGTVTVTVVESCVYPSPPPCTDTPKPVAPPVIITTTQTVTTCTQETCHTGTQTVIVPSRTPTPTPSPTPAPSLPMTPPTTPTMTTQTYLSTKYLTISTCSNDVCSPHIVSSIVTITTEVPCSTAYVTLASVQTTTRTTVRYVTSTDVFTITECSDTCTEKVMTTTKLATSVETAVSTLSSQVTVVPTQDITYITKTQVTTRTVSVCVGSTCLLSTSTGTATETALSGSLSGYVPVVSTSPPAIAPLPKQTSSICYESTCSSIEAPPSQCTGTSCAPKVIPPPAVCTGSECFSPSIVPSNSAPQISALKLLFVVALIL